mmetsp:Transcript_19108/g.38634  ORF Transcript_19108/g.38634 Transcript_19108/m.38634 type:complete len:209 (+) Transcript_19108:240-866(+)
MTLKSIKNISNISLLNNKNLHNLSKLKTKNSKIIITSKYFDAYEKKKKDMVYTFTNILTPVAYIPTMLYPILHVRDVINNFPINLIIYKYIMVIQNAASSYFLLYMASWIAYFYIFCLSNNFGRRFRHHANYGNEMEILYNAASFFFYAIGDVFRWTFITPILLSFVYTIMMGTIVYNVYYGLSYKFPHVPEVHYQVLSPPPEPRKKK